MSQFIGTLLARITADNSQFIGSINQSGAAMMGLAGTATKVFGGTAAMAAGAGIVSMLDSAVDKWGAFDEAMIKSTAIMPGLTDSMKSEMADMAKDMSTKVRQGASQIAESYFFLASAGLDAEQSMASLGTVTSFATAGAFDLSTATDLLTDAQSALGLTSKDAAENMENMTRVSDVLVKANTLANASVEQFSTALTSKAGAALKDLHKDVEEGVAVLAAYADQGVKAELAGERLSIVLRDLQTSNINNRQEWEKLGMRVYDANGRMLPMVDIIRQLENGLGGMSDEQRKSTLAMLGFQDRSQSAVIQLLGMSEKIRGYEKALRSAGGTTDEVANKQLKAFNAQWDILGNKIDLVWLAMADHLAPTLEWVNETMQDALDWFNGLDDSTQGLITGALALGSGLAAVTLGLGGLAFVLAPIVTAVGTLAAAGLPALLSALVPIGAVVAGIGIASATALAGWEIGKWIKELDPLKDALSWIHEKIGAISDTAKEIANNAIVWAVVKAASAFSPGASLGAMAGSHMAVAGNALVGGDAKEVRGASDLPKSMLDLANELAGTIPKSAEEAFAMASKGADLAKVYSRFSEVERPRDEKVEQNTGESAKAARESVSVQKESLQALRALREAMLTIGGVKPKVATIGA